MKKLATSLLILAVAGMALYASVARIPEGAVGIEGRGESARVLRPGFHFHSPFSAPPSLLPLNLPAETGEGTVRPADGGSYPIEYEISGRIDPGRVEEFQKARGDGDAGDLLLQAAANAILQTLEGKQAAFIAAEGMEAGVRESASKLLLPAGIVDVTFDLRLPGATLVALAHDLVHEGKASILRQRAEDAVARAGGKDWQPHAALGLVLEGQMDLKGAEARYLDALSIDPTAQPPMAQLFGLYSAVGEFEKLDRLLTTALQVDPDSVQHLTWLSASLMKQGRAEEALRPAEHAVELEPGNPLLLNNLAGIEAKAGRFEEATSLLRRALEANPEDRQTLFNLGVALAASGRYKESLEQLQAAEKLGPAGAPLLKAIASVHRKMGNRSKAAEYERRAGEAERKAAG